MIVNPASDASVTASPAGSCAAHNVPAPVVRDAKAVASNARWRAALNVTAPVMRNASVVRGVR